MTTKKLGCRWNTHFEYGVSQCIDGSLDRLEWVVLPPRHSVTIEILVLNMLLLNGSMAS
jgi:hypothetical protein